MTSYHRPASVAAILIKSNQFPSNIRQQARTNSHHYWLSPLPENYILAGVTPSQVSTQTNLQTSHYYVSYLVDLLLTVTK